jgi:hypothetical protein
MDLCKVLASITKILNMVDWWYFGENAFFEVELFKRIFDVFTNNFF